MLKYYAGIGSRKTPKEVLDKMTVYATILEQKGWILRSGGAKGADKAFENGIKNKENKEIFYTKDCEEWCLEEVQKYILPNMNFTYFKPYIKQLLGRNMKQILGKDGKTPVSFIVCWTPTLNYYSKEVGGTGYAIRCALAHNIPIINLNEESE